MVFRSARLEIMLVAIAAGAISIELRQKSTAVGNTNSSRFGLIPFWPKKTQQASNPAEVHQSVALIYNLDSAASAHCHSHHLFLYVQIAHTRTAAFRANPKR